MQTSISPSVVRELQRIFPQPALVDVRADHAFERDRSVIGGALRSAADIARWSATLEPWRAVVVYCVRGHAVSQDAAAALRGRGFDARYLEGGIEGWRAAGGATVAYTRPTRWVTRERPKVDRIACPWLIRRFIDPAAEFYYVPTGEVYDFALAENATPYDVPDVAYTHDGPRCSFDAFIHRHHLDDAALDDLAAIVRGADTAALDLAREAPGLLAVSLGMSRLFANDHAMLRFGMLVYDALYAWCREARGETHGWDPASLRTAAAAR